jgi:hypothetical protein
MMTEMFPSAGIAKKLHSGTSGDNAILASIVTVPATEYGIVWKAWFDLDVGDETDLENLVAILNLGVTIGSSSWNVNVHPYIEHTDAGPDVHRHVDLGPWFFDFGNDGFYSGVLGDDIAFAAAAAGTGIKVSVKALYSGD